jgi:hypothetical protein
LLGWLRALKKGRFTALPLEKPATSNCQANYRDEALCGISKVDAYIFERSASAINVARHVSFEVAAA